MKNWIVTCAALAACAVPFHAGGASAAAIDYIFTGAGSWTLNGVAESGDFTLTYVSDTSGINGTGQFFNSGVATFVGGGSTVTFMGTTDEVTVNQAPPGFMGFIQVNNSGPIAGPIAVEALTNPVFETYDLSTAFPLTNGELSTQASTFVTSGGDLVFPSAESITALSFQATMGSVPEPSTWAMMALGFAGLGFLGWRGSRNTTAHAA
jgi:hypothetical protein